MSSFKEIKKKSNIKVWENKIKRLYANESLTDEDLKYLNVQFDFYTLRKTYIFPISALSCLLFYNFYIIKDLNKYARTTFSIGIGYIIYNLMRKRNRIHYETIITPYFEKYYIK